MYKLLSAIRCQLCVLFVSRLGLSLLALFVGMSVFSASIYQKLVVRELPVVVIDLDHSQLSRLVTTSLEATPELAVQSLRGGSLVEVEPLIERGLVNACVVIPNGFSTNVKRGDKTRLVVAVDMSNILIGKTVRAAVGRVVATLNVGTELTVQKKLGVSRAQAEARSYPIVVEDNQLFNPATNYAEYLIPVVLYFMLHIYVTVLLAGTFLDETLSFLERVGRLLTTGVWSLILGALTWLYLPLSQVTVASGFWLGQLTFLAYVAAQTAFVVAIFTLYRGSKTGFQTILFLSMLGLMLSGVTWPTYAFPIALARLSELLPFTYLARLIRLTVHYQSQLPDVRDSLRSLAELTGMFVLVVVVSKALFAVVTRLRMGRGSHDTTA